MFKIFFNFEEKLIELNESTILLLDDILTIIEVFEFPPNESSNIFVKIELLYNILSLLTLSLNWFIIYENVSKDLFIEILYLLFIIFDDDNSTKLKDDLNTWYVSIFIFQYKKL